MAKPELSREDTARMIADSRRAEAARARYEAEYGHLKPAAPEPSES